MNRRPKSFTYQGRPLDYFAHRYNTTRDNERAVEIPIARDFIRRRRAGVPLTDGLEVGNVLSHYQPVLHRVIDRHEVADDVENLDVFDIAGRYPWIVSISTLEHVRWDEEPMDPAGAPAALGHLRGLLADGGRLLVTVPLGYHPDLDDHLADLFGEPDVAATVLVRDGDDGWMEGVGFERRRYGPWANALYVGEWGPNR